MISSYRSKAFYVSTQTFAMLKSMSEWEDLDCPDTLAESILSEWLHKQPKLKRFQAEQKKRMDALRAEAVDWPASGPEGPTPRRDKEQP